MVRLAINTHMESSYLKLLEKQHYKIFGKNRHSAAKLCLWTKKSLKNEGVCYKEKFYGVKSHRCLQMTPSLYCNQRCVFCWRAWENEPINFIPKEWDEPKEIIDEAIKAQRLLLSGFGGLEKTDKQKFKEAQEPNQAAISLDGEPTMYPYLGDLVAGYGRKKFTTFVVTNGQLTKRLEDLNPLPTQLYVSLDAPDETTFKKVNIPLSGASWQNLENTLSLLPSINTRKVIRITLIRGLNDFSPEKYAKIIEKSDVDFVEVKSYVCVGFSRNRLHLENMLNYDEIVAFANQIINKCNYSLVGGAPQSRVCLITKPELKNSLLIHQ